ncbi:MAG TPA: Gfo/Idh/MocA family oxidoreductase [Cyclobacteriaceae bacterium]|nr:Gfo/Idh/MocA family oxidoreductase [Cyclobacteriaceae bacterium]
MIKTFSALVLCMVTLSPLAQPLRLGIAGLTHGHVGWAFESAKKGDIEIVGIAEPDRAVAQRYARHHGFPITKIYSSLEEMLEATRPTAVAAFGSILAHRDVVRACAPRGIHVMVEKPLAISAEHASEMVRLAEQYGILLMTNYETTWYPTNHLASEWIRNDRIGTVRKIVIHDGHEGPQEIGVQEEFLAWLTDPEQNGGGAIVDFGCYGANLALWLMNGQLPDQVTAVTQTLKPEIYPRVDDEATIILTYPGAQVIIQASWNWPYGRKDLEIYGTNGYVFAENRHHVRYRFGEHPERQLEANERESPYNDPFLYFAACIAGEVNPDAHDLSGTVNNLNVMKILDAARESARTGRSVSPGKVN